MDLTPREFEQLQPQEFLKLLDGYNWRRLNYEATAAYFTAWLIAPHMKKSVQPLDILQGLRPDEVKKIRSKQQKSDEEYLKHTFADVLKKSKNRQEINLPSR